MLAIEEPKTNNMLGKTDDFKFPSGHLLNWHCVQIIWFRDAITHIDIEEKIYPFKPTSHNAPTMTEPLLRGLPKYC